MSRIPLVAHVTLKQINGDMVARIREPNKTKSELFKRLDHCS